MQFFTSSNFLVSSGSRVTHQIYFSYAVMQTDFGWTNGVALAFLEEFGWPKDRKLDC